MYPSAYANGWAVKWYNSKGGGWKSVSEGKTFFQFANDLEEALTPARQAVIDRERKKASETMNRASTPTPERNKAYARGSRINYLELKGLAKKSDKQGSDYQVNKREHAKWRKIEKSMKESVEQIDEADWGGGFETSGEAWSKVQAGLKADNKKRRQMILVAYLS